MDVNVTLDVPAMGKLLDYSASGVGAIAGSWLGPWMAERRGEVKRIEARAKADSIRELAQAKADAHKLAKVTEIEISEMVAERIQYQETKRLGNIRAVVELAAEELGDDEVPDQEPDHDWAARFFNYVQDISSEELQVLWSRVLAGKVRNRGSVSVHALSILRNMDRDTAEIFQRLCSLCAVVPQLNDVRVLSLGGNANTNALHRYGLQFSVLNILNEHGLIIADYHSRQDYRLGLTRKISWHGDDYYFLLLKSNVREWMLLHPMELPKNAEHLWMHGVSLTSAGRDLMPVVNVYRSIEYEKKMLEFFSSKGLRAVEVEQPLAG